jgi:hypothetical protein
VSDSFFLFCGTAFSYRPEAGMKQGEAAFVTVNSILLNRDSGRNYLPY